MAINSQWMSVKLMNLTNFLIILIIFGVVVLAGLYFILKKLLGQKPEKQDNQALIMLQNQLHELVRSNADLNKTIDVKLGQSAEMFQRQSGATHKIVAEVTEKLTRLDETNKQVINFTDQLQSLQDILKNPKQRGILGEYYLETLLKNVLPIGSYVMQYPFKDGTIVDAVVKVKDKIIPIDSKFSLENYNRLAEEKNPAERERLEKVFRNDLKLRIDETSKYVKASEGTMDFAFMFIPHEAIYYDLLIAQVGSVKVNTRDLIDYAFKEKHVIIVSPTSFLAYLQTVLQGLKALQIEETAKDIIKRVADLDKHLAAYDEYVKKVGTHLATTVNAYNF